ncbi:MAG: hypothetical protein N3F05_00555 [Candidatus Diapherotrites archaeon]|nr:hypothetical protein [Candidatus Diapherotrites archaeon]
MAVNVKLCSKASLLLVLILICANAFATVPRLLTVQGRLKDGTVLAHGDYNMTFYIYNASSGGTSLWSEQHFNVPVDRGYFSVILGESNPITLPFTTQYWLAIRVNNEAEMTPRLKLTNSSYAFYAIDANVSPSQWITSGSNIYYNLGNVGIGVTSPSYRLDVNGPLRLMPGTAPTGANGVIYYDTSTNKFRCYENGAWVNCISSGGGSIISAGDSNVEVVDAGDGYIVLREDNAEIMRVSGGNIGIGTTNPGTKLDVSGGSIRTSGQLISTVATGTSPLVVSSTTVVTNLNADMVDGYHSSSLARAKTIYLTSTTFYGNHNCDDVPTNCCASGYRMCRLGDLMSYRPEQDIIEYSGTGRHTSPWLYVNGWVDATYYNCNSWTSSEDGVYGSIVQLYGQSATKLGGFGYWNYPYYTQGCLYAARIWCCKEV